MTDQISIYLEPTKKKVGIDLTDPDVTVGQIVQGMVTHLRSAEAGFDVDHYVQDRIGDGYAPEWQLFREDENMQLLPPDARMSELQPPLAGDELFTLKVNAKVAAVSVTIQYHLLRDYASLPVADVVSLPRPTVLRDFRARLPKKHGYRDDEISVYDAQGHLLQNPDQPMSPMWIYRVETRLGEGRVMATDGKPYCDRHRVSWDEQQASQDDQCEDCGRTRPEHQAQERVIKVTPDALRPPSYAEVPKIVTDMDPAHLVRSGGDETLCQQPVRPGDVLMHDATWRPSPKERQVLCPDCLAALDDGFGGSHLLEIYDPYHLMSPTVPHLQWVTAAGTTAGELLEQLRVAMKERGRPVTGTERLYIGPWATAPLEDKDLVGSNVPYVLASLQQVDIPAIVAREAELHRVTSDSFDALLGEVLEIHEKLQGGHPDVAMTLLQRIADQHAYDTPVPNWKYKYVELEHAVWHMLEAGETDGAETAIKIPFDQVQPVSDMIGDGEPMKHYVTGEAQTPPPNDELPQALLEELLECCAATGNGRWKCIRLDDWPEKRGNHLDEDGAYVFPADVPSPYAAAITALNPETVRKLVMAFRRLRYGRTE